ncbi:hypothetical protein [Glaciimonas soli]|uniref:Uncharacterized protein n=1 Tax=Glaciimonas soli TaxID=2590999 RepID=A0A843YRZ7_9BURK|nr:hypothetical protein [Glaciimonas soli]MQR02335.1 hypothetical protein [Glaciimonas soli]
MDPLELAISLYKERSSAYERDIKVIVPTELDFLSVVATLEKANLLVDTDQAKREIEFALPSLNSAPFFIHIADLLATPERRATIPERFYIAEIDYLYGKDHSAVPAIIQNYLDTSKLLKLISTIADHIADDGGDKQYVFLGKEKIIFTADYVERDLRGLDGLTQFQQDFFESDIHAEQKKTIIRSALLEMFKGAKMVPFASLLHCYSLFIEEVRKSYELYVSEFSFHKIKAEVEKEKLDLTTKLNKVFSDIQNQLLAIPAALILAGGQLDDSHKWSLKNLLIWLGSLVFTILMVMLIRNQRHTLDAVKQEIEQQWADMSGRHQAVAYRFQEAYTQLDKRYSDQRKLLKNVKYLVYISLVVTSIVLLWYSFDVVALWEKTIEVMQHYAKIIQSKITQP